MRHEHEIQPAASTAARARHGASVWTRADPARRAVGAFVSRHEGGAACLYRSVHGNHRAGHAFAASRPSPAHGQPDMGITGGGSACPTRCGEQSDAGNAAPQRRRQAPATAWIRLAGRTSRCSPPGAPRRRTDRRVAKRSVGGAGARSTSRRASGHCRHAFAGRRGCCVGGVYREGGASGARQRSRAVRYRRQSVCGNRGHVHPQRGAAQRNGPASEWEFAVGSRRGGRRRAFGSHAGGCQRQRADELCHDLSAEGVMDWGQVV
jgi:hypothetical protein